MIEGVLFDMDGVLLDSERYGRGVFLEGCRARGYAVTEETYAQLLGRTEEASRQWLLNRFGPAFPYDDVRRLFQQQLLQDAEAGRIPLKKGVEECFSGLKARGLPMALATSTARPIVERYMKGIPALQNAFDAMVCGGEGGRSKPAPDIYLEAARRIGVEPEKCIGVEDSRAGLQSLTAARVPSVMVPDLLPYGKDLAPFVQYRLDDLTQLCGLIDRLNLEGRHRAQG